MQYLATQHLHCMGHYKSYRSDLNLSENMYRLYVDLSAELEQPRTLAYAKNMERYSEQYSKMKKLYFGPELFYLLS